MKLLNYSIKILYYLFSQAQEVVSIKFFKEDLKVDYSHVSQLISELKSKELLTKEKKGRSTRVKITKEGRTLVQEHAKAQITKIQEYFMLFNDTFHKGAKFLEERLKILRDYFSRMTYLVTHYDGIHKK